MFHCVYIHYYYIVPQLLSIDLLCMYVKTTVIKYFYPSSAVLCFTQNVRKGLFRNDNNKESRAVLF